MPVASGWAAWNASADADTLDKIVPSELAQNTAAYAVFTWLAAQADGGFGSAVKAAS